MSRGNFRHPVACCDAGVWCPSCSFMQPVRQVYNDDTVIIGGSEMKEELWEVRAVEPPECDEDGCKSPGLFRVHCRDDEYATSPPMCREHARVVADELNRDQRAADVAGHVS